MTTVKACQILRINSLVYDPSLPIAASYSAEWCGQEAANAEAALTNLQNLLAGCKPENVDWNASYQVDCHPEGEIQYHDVEERRSLWQGIKEAFKSFSDWMNEPDPA